MTPDEYEDLLDDLARAEQQLENLEDASLEHRVTDPELHARTVRIVRQRVETLRIQADEAWASFDTEE